MRKLTTATFGLLMLLAVGSAAFRVATAPERIKERRETAQAVCRSSGGQWVQVDEREHGCLHAASTPQR